LSKPPAAAAAPAAAKVRWLCTVRVAICLITAC
jgi:hypothetical protein